LRFVVPPAGTGIAVSVFIDVIEPFIGMLPMLPDDIDIAGIFVSELSWRSACVATGDVTPIKLSGSAELL
jgi:hypothetical protein